MKPRKTILAGCIMIIMAFIITFIHILTLMIQHATVNPEYFAEKFWDTPQMAFATLFLWFGSLITVLGVRKLILQHGMQ